MKFEVPDWLAVRNDASWRALLKTDDGFWRPEDSPLLRLVQRLGEGDVSRAFRAGSSLGLGILISTAERYGLKTNDRFVVARMDSDRIHYEYRAGDEVLHRQLCDEAEAFDCLIPLLDRLWTETRKPRYDEVKRVAMGDIGLMTIGTRVEGRVRFADMVPDKTFSVAERVILSHEGELHPHIAIDGEDGKELARYYLPWDAEVVVNDGQLVNANKLLAVCRSVVF